MINMVKLIVCSFHCNVVQRVQSVLSIICVDISVLDMVLCTPV